MVLMTKILDLDAGLRHGAQDLDRSSDTQSITGYSAPWFKMIKKSSGYFSILGE